MKTFRELLNIISEDNGGGAAPAASGTPANSVSAGGVYGARGNPDETIVHQAAHLKRMKEEDKNKPKTPRKMYITINGSTEGPRPDVGRNVGRDGY
jgi:hypothetical protein